MATILVSAGPGDGFLVVSAIRELMARLKYNGHRLVFTDYPAVNLMIASLAESLEIDPNQYDIYSTAYRDHNEFITVEIPIENSDYTLTDTITYVLKNEKFDGQLIIGGDIKTQLEMEAFKQTYPDMPVLAIGSTGGLAKRINPADDDINFVAILDDFFAKFKPPKPQSINVHLAFHPIEFEPEEYGEYSVIVPNKGGGYNLKEAVYALPSESAKPGWFYVTASEGLFGQTSYSPILDAVLWTKTRNMELDPEAAPPNPRERKFKG